VLFAAQTSGFIATYDATRTLPIIFAAISFFVSGRLRGIHPNITGYDHNDGYCDCSDAECENEIVGPEHSRRTEAPCTSVPSAPSNQENIWRMPNREVRKITVAMSQH